MLVRYAVIGLLAGIAPAKAQVMHGDFDDFPRKGRDQRPDYGRHRAALRLQWPGG